MANDQRIDLVDMAQLLLFPILPETNLIFQSKKVALDRGLALLLDEDLSEDRVIQNLTESIGAVEIKNLKKDKTQVWNYQLKLHKFSPNDKLEDVQQFLYDGKSLAAIVVYGIVPESLKEWVYTFKLSVNQNNYMRSTEFTDTINLIKKFIRDNPALVSRKLDLLKSSEFYLSGEANSSLFVSLAAAVSVYSEYFRESHLEEETAREKERMQDEVKKMVHTAYELEEEFDLLDAVKKAVTWYFDVSTEYTIAHINCVEGKVIKAVEETRVILYNEEFYFVSEPLFRKACKMLLNTVSLIDIKNILWEEDILCCNQIKRCNFTVKKVFVNAYGETCRGRFLKIRKEFLTSDDRLTLEERKGGRENDGRRSICWPQLLDKSAYTE